MRNRCTTTTCHRCTLASLLTSDYRVRYVAPDALSEYADKCKYAH